MLTIRPARVLTVPRLTALVLLTGALCLLAVAATGCVGTDSAGNRVLNKPLGSEAITAEEVQAAVTAGLAAGAAHSTGTPVDWTTIVAAGLALLGVGKAAHLAGKDAGWTEAVGKPAVAGESKPQA